MFDHTLTGARIGTYTSDVFLKVDNNLCTKLNIIITVAKLTSPIFF